MHSVIFAGAVTALATLLVAPEAFAAPSRFEVEPKLGYAGTLNTGLSPYGAFIGLGVRARPIAHLWLSTSLFSYVGSSAAADGPRVTYRAHDRAYALSFDATWRFETPRFFIEPGAEVGAAWNLGSTYVTPMQISDSYVAGNVGPVLRVAVVVHRVGLGAEGAALFVPSYVTAPILRAGALVVLPL